MALSDAGSVDTFEGADRGIKSVRIGLISDTHIPRDTRILPPHVGEAFKDVDLILHAGDIYLPSVLDELENIAPVLAARGNGDWEFPRDHRLKKTQVFDVAGLSVGLTHGINHTPSPEYYDKMMEREFGKRVDVVVFGDTHVATVERNNGTLLVNPGNPALPGNRFELGTVGLLEIEGSRARVRIVQLSEFSLPFNRELIYHPGTSR